MGFQGASAKLFTDFSLEKVLRNSTIMENRRSTNIIIDFINRIRKDIKQEYQRKVTGDKTSNNSWRDKKAYLKAKELCEIP